MVNVLNMLQSLIFMLDGSPLGPLYDGIGTVGPYALSIVAVLSLFYAVFLGVKYAKAQSADEKANAQKILVNFVIGAITVVVLIAVVIAIREPLTVWIQG